MHAGVVGLLVAAAALPAPVQIRPDPEGVALGDPAFQPIAGARADYGRLGGTVYQVEMPKRWNGKLVLFMHGYGELRPTADVSPPAIRSSLVRQGYAWAASSFSSTSLIPGRAADETAALWDYVARRYGRPKRSYITGVSMGGAATHVAAERYANRFDGALALCGAASQTPALRITSDFFAAAAYVAGVDQAEFDRSTDIVALVRDRIRPALRRRGAHKRFEDIMVSIDGGPRPFDREGFRMEEENNWGRATLSVAAGLAINRDTVYRLGAPSPVSSAAFNRGVIRYRTNAPAVRAFLAGSETSGRIAMPTISLHTTGDGQVPFEQARILQRKVDAAGRGRLLVQRVFRDAGHCGFRDSEWQASLDALDRWVERGVKPAGNDVLPANAGDARPRFELAPRLGTPEADAVPGARRRVVLHGKLRLDGRPLDARFLGAIVRRGALMSPCQLTLPTVAGGRYEIGVMADAEGAGCGAPGARIELWTFASGTTLHSTTTVPWPRRPGRARFDAAFSTAAPDGAGVTLSGFFGDVFTRAGRRFPSGTRVEAFVGATRCAVSSLRRTGSFSGYSLGVVGPDAVPACARGATLTFRVNGRLAPETAVNEPGRSDPLDLTAR